MHRVTTPTQHQVTNLLIFAFKPTPTAKLIGAPTEIVPKKPKPNIPYLFHNLMINGCFFSANSLDGLFLWNRALILLPKNAAIKTPIKPPVTLAKNITQGDNPKANPAGMAA